MSEPTLKDVLDAEFKEGGALALTPHVNFWMGLIDSTSYTEEGVTAQLLLMDMFISAMPQEVRGYLEMHFHAKRH